MLLLRSDLLSRQFWVRLVDFAFIRYVALRTIASGWCHVIDVPFGFLYFAELLVLINVLLWAEMILLCWLCDLGEQVSIASCFSLPR